jgi:hypothetical protein
VESIVINDGSAQRSQITSVTVTFDAVVDASAAAFVLTNIDTSTTVTNVEVDLAEKDFKTVATLTFGTDGASVVNRAGTGQLGNSLADGNYKLEVLAAQVTDPTTGVAGLSGGNVIFGDDVKGDVPNDDFFRLFGDNDGDEDTDFTDFSDGFLPGFGSNDGDDDFRSFLDFDGDGDIDFQDFSQGFLPAFGNSRT